MNVPRYGSQEWIARLPPGVDVVARLEELIVIRFHDGTLGKVVGGSPEQPSVIALSQDEMRAAVPIPNKIGIDAPPPLTIAWPYTDWVTWYNTGATPVEQEKFDRISKVLDAGGSDYMQGGPNAAYIENWQFTEPNVYKALVLYRDSGGRRALFASKTPDYGDNPISVVKLNGPITRGADGTVTIHPGRYTYSTPQPVNVSDLVKFDLLGSIDKTPFKQWLDAAVTARTAQVLTAQATEDPSHLASWLTLHSAPLFIDYEFLVATDIPWNSDIIGLPSWLPRGVGVEKYWGKPTPHAKPNLDALREAAERVKHVLEDFTTAAVVIGIGYLLMLIGNARQSSSRHA